MQWLLAGSWKTFARRAGETNSLILLARPKRFELLTPKFVVWSCKLLICLVEIDVLNDADNDGQQKDRGKGPVHTFTA